MNLTHLGKTNFNDFLDCFLQAFENYFVKMPTDPTYYRQRWKAAKVQFDLSYGMYDQGKLVGFILNAIDERDGEMIAFNTGTGVIPSHRGNRIVKSIYEFAIPDLLSNGIDKCALEVIVANEIAIKAYQGIGFQITKTYHCFNGELPSSNTSEVKLEEITYEKFASEYNAFQQFYSWDNHKNPLQFGDYKYCQILRHGAVESYFAINPSNGYLAQFEVLDQSPQAWNRLCSGIQHISNTVKINNVHHLQREKLDWLNSIALPSTVDQYEMEMPLIVPKS